MVQQAIEPLITLRNQFHHPGIPEVLIPAKIDAGTRWLDQLLERLQFLDAETAHLSKTVVVILDQFEEFFLRLPLEVRRLFHQELGACVAAAHLDVHFIIALRDDYFSALAEFQEAIPDLFTHEMRLTRFTPAQALAAAVEPVKRVGWSIDETLVAEVLLPQLDEFEKGIEPPLLQIVCDALYQQADETQGVETRGLLEAHAGTPGTRLCPRGLSNVRHHRPVRGGGVAGPPALRSLSFYQTGPE